MWLCLVGRVGVLQFVTYILQINGLVYRAFTIMVKSVYQYMTDICNNYAIQVLSVIYYFVDCVER